MILKWLDSIISELSTKLSQNEMWNNFTPSKILLHNMKKNGFFFTFYTKSAIYMMSQILKKSISKTFNLLLWTSSNKPKLICFIRFQAMVPSICQNPLSKLFIKYFVKVTQNLLQGILVTFIYKLSEDQKQTYQSMFKHDPRSKVKTLKTGFSHELPPGKWGWVLRSTVKTITVEISKSYWILTENCLCHFDA